MIKILEVKSKGYTWDDLREYKYRFNVTPKYSPNFTFNDDVLRVADNCGCLKLDSRVYPRRQFYVCKSVSDYDKFVKSLESGSLKDYADISDLKSFDAEDLIAELKLQWKKNIKKYSPDLLADKKFQREILPAVYIIDYHQGSVRLQMPRWKRMYDLE